ARELAGSHPGDLAVGGQDLHPNDKGAHTGDVSGAQLADAGCAWVLCGHSERRRDHGESDELVGEKAAAALRHGLTPMICVGETRDERRAGGTSILYGGSVTPDNAAALIAPPDIDGFLVGGASLDPRNFLTIIRVSG